MKSIQLLVGRTAARTARCAPRSLHTRAAICPLNLPSRSNSREQNPPQSRHFTVHAPRRISMTPDSADPKPPNTQDSASHAKEPANITDADYHEIADQYMNTLQLVLEEAENKDTTKGIEVEYSAGVLTLLHPEKGTYVINKQPPNRQIWLSSPVSGPKRFDWVLGTANQHDAMNSKQDTEGSTGAMGDDGHLGGGKWVYLRDGTGLSELIKDELDIIVAKSDEPDATPGREGPGKGGEGGVEG